MTNIAFLYQIIQVVRESERLSSSDSLLVFRFCSCYFIFKDSIISSAIGSHFVMFFSVQLNEHINN